MSDGATPLGTARQTKEYMEMKKEEEISRKDRMSGMQSCRGSSLSGASSLHLIHCKNSCCSQGWVWSPKRGERMWDTQAGQATLPCPPLQLSPLVWEGEENCPLWPSGSRQAWHSMPTMTSASPVGRGPVTSAPQPGAAQSLLCSLLKTKSLRGSEWLYYKSSRPCGIPVVPKLPMTGTTYI